MELPEVLNVEEAVDELRQRHSSYLHRVLISLRDNFQEQNEDPLLEANFFPHLRINELISLHTDLDTELQILEVCHDEVGRVFEQFRDRFLVYCQVLEKVNPLLQFLVNQMETSKEIRYNFEKQFHYIKIHFRDQVEEMEQFAASKSSDPRDFHCLRELVSTLGTHLTKYPLLMDAIEKWAGKAQ